MKITKQRLTAIIKEELKEIMDLPSDLSTPAGPEEERMESLSRGWEKHINTEVWLNVEVLDPIDGKKKQLDEFIAILGNYVVSGDVEEADANALVKEIAGLVSSSSYEPNPHDWGTPLPKWEDTPGFEPQDEEHPYEDTDLVDRGELKEGGLAGHLEPEDAILKALQSVVSAWEPETPEGQKYEADILDLLNRFEEPLRLSAPNAEDIERLKQGLRRQKSPRSPGDFRHWRDRWEK